MTAALGVAYAVAMRHRRRTQGLTRHDRRAIVWFSLGLAVFWVASDWPLATLGGAYLLSVHVVIYMLYTFGAAPLLLLGVPRWMADRMLARLHGAAMVSALAVPWIAGLQINAVLVLTHLPPVVDTMRASQLGSFALDVIWMVSALVAWLPVASPRTEDRIESPIYTCVYLFLAFQLFPMLPGSLITFAGLPVYRVYELAPRIGSWSAISDQQLAGAPDGHGVHAGAVDRDRGHLHPGPRRGRHRPTPRRVRHRHRPVAPGRRHHRHHRHARGVAATASVSMNGATNGSGGSTVRS